MPFRTTDKNLFFSKNDPQDQRLGDFVKDLPLDQLSNIKNSYLIAGYPDDEGIALNGGRLGAKEAPDCIRKYFYKMTASATNSSIPQIFDIGNLDTSPELPQRHKNIIDLAQQILETNTWIALGGGHDYAYPDGAAFLKAQQSSSLKPLIINFDAHLDVRPDDKGLSSGTPFYRLLRDYKNFDFAEIGIQSQCNSQQHLQWCLDQGGDVLTWEDINFSGLSPEVKVLQFLEPKLIPARPTFLSVDIDAFSSSYAMGCSQSWPSGFTADSFYKILKTLKSRLKIHTLGIYEVSPRLDLDDRTSKLAAQIIHQFIYS